MKKQSTEQFIIEAKEKHGDKYDYSKVEYENNLKEVIIICKEHGEFLQLPKTHKRGNGCKDCGREKTINGKKSNKNDFIKKAKEIHGDKYDYSKVEYIKANEKVVIICKEHGEFQQTPNSHLYGAGCKKCSTEINSDKQRKTLEEFIIEACEKHGDNYDYSKVDYINYNTIVLIICKEHGEFQQTPNNHLSGKKCYKCSILSRIEKRTKTTDKFIKEAKEKHGDKFDYSKTNYNNCNEQIIIICKEHGEFQQTPISHLNGSICCQKCVLNNIGKWNNSNSNEFIEKSNVIHNNKYDYSKVEYINANKKVVLVCKIHGDFEITPNSHLNGSGCYYCGKLNMAQKQSLSKEEFVQKSIDIHGNIYDYSKVEYVNNHSKILIICKNHGDFVQTPQGHLSGRGCIKCVNKYCYTTDEWIHMAKNIHGDIYDYSKTKYISAKNNVIITCKTHGDFEQQPTVHLRPTGCSRCNPKKFSKTQIEWLNFISILQKISIQHAMNGIEFTIPSTRYKTDGYCKENNTIYEFHGDLWHGNPKIFNSNGTSFFGVKYGELYQNTLQREQLIRDLGYNLVVMWEHDWKTINKSIKILQRKFCSNR